MGNIVHVFLFRFLLAGEMEGGCKPILTVSLLPSSKDRSMLWSKETNEPGALVVPEEEEEQGKSEEENGAILDFVQKYVGAVAAGVVMVLVVLIVVARKICKSKRKRRGTRVDSQ